MVRLKEPNEKYGSDHACLMADIPCMGATNTTVLPSRPTRDIVTKLVT